MADDKKKIGTGLEAVVGVTASRNPALIKADAIAADKERAERRAETLRQLEALTDGKVAFDAHHYVTTLHPVDKVHYAFLRNSDDRVKTRPGEILTELATLGLTPELVQEEGKWFNTPATRFRVTNEWLDAVHDQVARLYENEKTQIAEREAKRQAERLAAEEEAQRIQAQKVAEAEAQRQAQEAAANAIVWQKLEEKVALEGKQRHLDNTLRQTFVGSAELYVRTGEKPLVTLGKPETFEDRAHEKLTEFREALVRSSSPELAVVRELLKSTPKALEVQKFSQSGDERQKDWQYVAVFSDAFLKKLPAPERAPVLAAAPKPAGVNAPPAVPAAPVANAAPVVAQPVAQARQPAPAARLHFANSQDAVKHLANTYTLDGKRKDGKEDTLEQLQTKMEALLYATEEVRAREAAIKTNMEVVLRHKDKDTAQAKEYLTTCQNALNQCTARREHHQTLFSRSMDQLNARTNAPGLSNATTFSVPPGLPRVPGQAALHTT